MKLEAGSLLGGAPILPIVSPDDADQAELAVRALLAGGLRCVEIVFRTAAAADAIARLRSVDGMVVGAGTVVSAEQVQVAANAGAQFAVSPGLDDEVVIACHEIGLPVVAGVATASEILRARRLGLEVLKLFPARELGGPPFVRSIAAVFPDTQFIPTGGIDQETAAGYLELPAVLACGGSWIAPPELLRAADFEAISKAARIAAEMRR
jgi:2-dehydro-3-deoxyphosphogluconate aldolase/(4S)-4-hydroxy-2-oxoglutarate aldolase